MQTGRAPESLAGVPPVARRRPVPAQRQRRQAATHALSTVLASWAELTVVALFAITFLVQPFQIPSESMERTLLVGDFVLTNKQVFAPAGHWGWLLPYRDPERASLLVFHYPVQPGKLLVKRVIAVPGDTIRMHRGVAILNGVPQRESFAGYQGGGRSHFRDEFPSLLETDPEVQAAWWIELRRMATSSPVVPSGSYFVLGDNRNDSIDSRFWGWVPRAGVVGEPMLVSISLDREHGGWKAVRWRRCLRVLR